MCHQEPCNLHNLFRPQWGRMLLLVLALSVASLPASAQKWRLSAGYGWQKFGLKFSENPAHQGSVDASRKGLLQVELQRYFLPRFYLAGKIDFLLQNQQSTLFGGPVNFDHGSGGLLLGLEGNKIDIFFGGQIGRIWDINFKARDNMGSSVRLQPLTSQNAWIPAYSTGIRYYLFSFLRLEAEFTHTFNLPEAVEPERSFGVEPALQSFEIKPWSFTTGISISVPWGKRSRYRRTGRKIPPPAGSAANLNFQSPLRRDTFITSPFGPRGRANHLGVDLEANTGDGVYAIAAGVVEEAGRRWGSGYGKMVKIRHAGGYSSLYAHLSSIKVEEGQRLEKGERIGTTGQTGKASGPHLHLELLQNGLVVNPQLYIQF